MSTLNNNPNGYPKFHERYAKEAEKYLCLEHILMIKTPIQISHKTMISSIEKFLKLTNIPTDYELNYATGLDDKYKGFCFLWVSDVRVYYFLFNRDEYGEDRYDSVINPNFELIQKKRDEMMKELENKSKPNTVSWTDIDDLEIYLEDTYGPDYIKYPKKPLFELPHAYIESNNKKVRVEFQFEPVRYASAIKGRQKQVLFAQKIPDEVTLNEIQSNFERIAKHEFKATEVTRKTGRCIQVEFNNVVDAFIILQLFRKRLIKTQKNVSLPLIFNYCLKFSK